MRLYCAARDGEEGLSVCQLCAPCGFARAIWADDRCENTGQSRGTRIASDGCEACPSERSLLFHEFIPVQEYSP
jgi:hypothetical protein